MPNSDKREAYFDNLRFILMLIVVYCHGIELFRSKSDAICVVHNSLLLFVMPLFVFISGFFAKNMGKADSPKRNKILNLIVLYLIAQAVKCFISGGFTIIQPIYGNWYLICLIAWYTILPLFSSFKPWLIISISVLFGLLIGIEKSGMSILQISRMLCFFPFFLLGYYLNKETIEFVKRKYIIGIIGFAIACVAINYLSYKGLPLSIMHASKCYKDMKLSVPSGVFYRLIWYCLSAFACFSVMCLVPTKHNIFTVLGTRTLPIYILHTCLFYYLRRHTPLVDYILNNVRARYIIIVGFAFSLLVTIIFGNRIFSRVFDGLMKYDFQHQKE